MQDIWLRVFLAATISAIGIVFTHMYSLSHRTISIPKDNEPIARLISATNEVQRRPAERLIWQNTLDSEELYSGEAVRTGRNATARIEFLKRGATIDLDPDTVIEIEETKNGLNLDFLVGNVVIRSSGSAGPGPTNKITVQSGGQKLELKKDVAVSFAKTSKQANLDVDVIQGDIKDVSEAVKVEIALPKLKVLQPRRGEFFYSEPGKGASITFKWEPLEDENYDVFLETGADRYSLKPVSGLTPIAISAGQLKTHVPEGKTYFRLKAKRKDGAKDEIESVISAVELKPKLAPLLLEPAMNADYPMTSVDHPIEFRWTNHGDLEKTRLEISSTADFQKIVVSEIIEHAAMSKQSLIQHKGDLYWRVSGRLPGTQTMIVSAIRKFSIGTASTIPQSPSDLATALPAGAGALTSATAGDFAAPVPQSPKDGEHVAFKMMQTDGTWLTWSKVKGAETYEVTLVGAKTYHESVRSTSLRALKLSPGTYRWSVAAKRTDGTSTPDSSARSLTVDESAALAWADGLTSTKVLYRTKKPRVSLAWQKGPGQPARWRTRLVASRQPASETDWKYTDSPESVFEPGQAGLYRAEAESLSADGRVIASAPMRSVDLQPAPLPEPPVFNSPKGKPIAGRADGSAQVDWKKVEDAKEYRLEVKDDDGEVVKAVTSPTNHAMVKDLEAGDYKVSLQTIDTEGRSSPPGEARDLKIPETSGVRAPKIKKLQIH